MLLQVPCVDRAAFLLSLSLDWQGPLRVWCDDVMTDEPDFEVACVRALYQKAPSAAFAAELSCPGSQPLGLCINIKDV